MKTFDGAGRDKDLARAILLRMGFEIFSAESHNMAGQCDVSWQLSVVLNDY